MINLLEIKISASTLVSYLDSLEDQADEAGVEYLYFPPEEVQMIATLAKALNLACSAGLENTNLLEH